MEQYLAVTGTIQSINEWESDMNSIRLPYKWGKKKGDKGYIRLGVCPIRLYKIFHPEEHEESVMALSGVGYKGNYVLKRYRVLRWIQKTMKKALGLKKCKIPSKELVDKYLYMQPNQTTKAVAVVPIGMKKDAFSEDGIEII